MKVAFSLGIDETGLPDEEKLCQGRDVRVMNEIFECIQEYTDLGRQGQGLANPQRSWTENWKIFRIAWLVIIIYLIKGQELGYPAAFFQFLCSLTQPDD